MPRKNRHTPEKTHNTPGTHPPTRGVLVLTSGNGCESEFGLKPGQTIVGRGPGADIAFEDCTMASAHAVFEQTGGRFIVRSLGKGALSLNGTPIKEAELKTGDTLELGEYSFRFIAAEKAPSRCNR